MHTHSCQYRQKIPKRVLKHIAEKIIKIFEEESCTIPEDINTNIPDYKTEFTLIAKERLITGVRVYNGAYVDGTGFD